MPRASGVPAPAQQGGTAELGGCQGASGGRHLVQHACADESGCHAWCAGQAGHGHHEQGGPAQVVHAAPVFQRHARVVQLQALPPKAQGAGSGGGRAAAPRGGSRATGGCRGCRAGERRVWCVLRCSRTSRLCSFPSPHLPPPTPHPHPPITPPHPTLAPHQRPTNPKSSVPRGWWCGHPLTTRPMVSGPASLSPPPPSSSIHPSLRACLTCLTCACTASRHLTSACCVLWASQMPQTRAPGSCSWASPPRTTWRRGATTRAAQMCRTRRCSTRAHTTG